MRAPRAHPHPSLGLALATCAACLGLGCASEPTEGDELDRLLARRVQGLRAPLVASDALDASARGLATTATRVQEFQALEVQRLESFPRLGSRATDTFTDDLRKLSRAGERASQLLGVDAAPLPDQSDAERDTDPFQTRPRTSLWSRILQRLGF